MNVLRMQAIAIDYLMLNSAEAVYTKNKISKSTFYRLVNNPEFIEVLEAEKDRLFNDTMIKAQSMSLQALDTLRNISMNEKAPFSARVSAAKAILDNARYFNEYSNIITRIEALEEIERCKED